MVEKMFLPPRKGKRRGLEMRGGRTKKKKGDEKPHGGRTWEYRGGL